MRRISHRLSYRFVGIWLVAGLLLTAVAASAQANLDPVTVTVTFTGAGPEPVFCSARPDPADVTIRVGTELVLANLTGVTATLDLGRGRSVTLADGEAVGARLGRGEHTLRMTPDCLLTRTDPVLVRMLTPPEFDDLPISASGTVFTPPAQPGPGLTGSGEPGPGQSAPASWETASWETGPVRPSTPQPDSAGTWPVLTAGDASPLLYGSLTAPYPIDRPVDRTGSHLVAVVAAICVLGVTSGIIRAIVAHRASRVSRTIAA